MYPPRLGRLRLCYPVGVTRALLPALVLFFASACGTSGPTLEQRARAALERDGFSELTLTRAEGEGLGTYDFQGVRRGERCTGTIAVHLDGASETNAIQSRCGE
jgi:hypothetical protein